MNIAKRLISVVIFTVLVFSCISVDAGYMGKVAVLTETESQDNNITENESDPAESESESSEEDYTDILFLGNSLIYYNSMNTEIFPEMCQAAGKKVRVTSITKSGSALYQYASEETSIGKQALTAIAENNYDYVILQPSRKATPFEYSVYHAEKKAAIKLNRIINESGAKTLLLSHPGLNTGNIQVYNMNADGISSSALYSLPIDRNTHSVYVENLCRDFSADMINTEIVKIGSAAEVLLEYFPEYNTLYKDDNKHPSTRGSYLQALCIYSAIFKEDYIGTGYTNSLKPYNALIAQRAACVAILNEAEEIMLINELQVNLQGELTSNTTAKLYWQESATPSYYEIYQKKGKEKYALIGRTITDECEYTISDLESGVKYSYKIKPIETVGDLTFPVKYSSEISLETLADPDKVSLTLKNKKNVIIDIKSVEGAEYYNIYRMKIGDGKYKFLTSTTALQYVDNKVKPDNTYAYKVTAVKQNGTIESQKSTAVKIVSLAAPKINVTSVKKKASAKNGTATIKISAVDGATGYAIYSSFNKDYGYKFVTTTDKLNYKATSLVRGKTYYFRVRAYKEKNAKTRASMYSVKKVKIR